ncbi:hypothetical protein [Streptomyces sporangiiformans]|uniref:HEAT repeat domain-containing protein n=1 Tax=Streptomyces sporangiiformans TaxID=2315329 RepID=A0A505D5C8_9ACTN|nr:hypothetical protein [Streptomyces sporangiiformans]TPQ19753.1 hypothetical protein FGD71_024185 [Streptomyces sporangiiformans]
MTTEAPDSESTEHADNAETTKNTEHAENKEEEQDRPQDAWSARRDLVDHSPKSMHVGANSRFGGSLVAGDQHGVSGGLVAGDVIMGGKTEIYHFGVSAAGGHGSGEVPPATLDRLAPYFVAEESVFEGLVTRLRTERVVVLSGPHFTGRRTAALMLLHRLGVSPVRTLVRDTTPEQLVQQLSDDKHPARGYVLCDLTTRRDQPLREPHLLAARDQLSKDDGYLVITVGPTAALEDISPVRWKPPSPGDVLTAHLRVLTDEATAHRLLTLPAVAEFLGRDHQLREVAEFAKTLKRYADGEVDEAAVRNFSLFSLENQVQEWFEEDEEQVPLRDKAFLVALAAFDGGPYALTAELSDLLYAFLQGTENSAVRPRVPVFGTHIGKRLQLARAERFKEEESTEWGPVIQSKAAFRDDRVSLVLLREVWTGHPSARPALVHWLQRLADDGRPLVRTRAASTVAVLAYTDLPSTMALVIEPWATSRLFRRRLVAVNALTLAHLLDAPNIPRILDAWCESDDEGMCWVAIRAYGLIGAERPEQTLAALRNAIRKQYERPGHDGDSNRDGDGDGDGVDDLMVKQLAQSVELLLLSPAGDQVLTELLRTLDDDRAVHDLALSGFLSACRRRKDDERHGQPLVLDWYATSAADGGRAAGGIARLWRAALDDRRHTRDALEELTAWIHTADRDPEAERALARLLPSLAGTAAEHQRLSHLLRTMRGEDSPPPPDVAARLLTTLSARH